MRIEAAKLLNRLGRLVREGGPNADVRASIENGCQEVERVPDGCKEQEAEFHRLYPTAKELGL